MKTRPPKYILWILRTIAMVVLVAIWFFILSPRFVVYHEAAYDPVVGSDVIVKQRVLSYSVRCLGITVFDKQDASPELKQDVGQELNQESEAAEMYVKIAAGVAAAIISIPILMVLVVFRIT